MGKARIHKFSSGGTGGDVSMDMIPFDSIGRTKNGIMSRYLV